MVKKKTFIFIIMITIVLNTIGCSTTETRLESDNKNLDHSLNNKNQDHSVIESTLEDSKEKSSEINPEVISKDSVDSAGDYLGLTVENVTELIGKKYEVVNSWDSTGFHYEDIQIFFLIGELFPEGHKLTGQEIVKFMEVYDGQVVPGAYVGNSAEEIISALNIVDSTLEFSEHAESEGDPPYVLYYETELNGYKSLIWFYFESPDGVCEYAYVKSDELY